MDLESLCRLYVKPERDADSQYRNVGDRDVDIDYRHHRREQHHVCICPRRTHEIGIRRAIGAKPHDILTQVIVESVALTTIFGYIGIIMGTVGTSVLDKMFADTDFIKNPTVDLSIATQVTIILIIAGALAGFFPAMRALKIKPVEALRTE